MRKQALEGERTCQRIDQRRGQRFAEIASTKTEERQENRPWRAPAQPNQNVTEGPIDTLAFAGENRLRVQGSSPEALSVTDDGCSTAGGTAGSGSGSKLATRRSPAVPRHVDSH